MDIIMLTIIRDLYGNHIAVKDLRAEIEEADGFRMGGNQCADPYQWCIDEERQKYWFHRHQTLMEIQSGKITKNYQLWAAGKK
jgi:hypothetical protein